MNMNTEETLGANLQTDVRRPKVISQKSDAAQR